MLEKQVEQDNEADVEVFENKIRSNVDELGFDWKDTIEGLDFWWRVIKHKSFELFFGKYPKDEPKPEYKPFDFSDGIKNHLDLIGKKIVSIDGNSIFAVTELEYIDTAKASYINDISTENLLKSYTFKDGSPVGVKI